MKNFYLIALCLVLTNTVFATTWRVNSNPKAGAHFATVQEAIDAASSGDVIQIESGSYEGFTVDKELHIIGTCYESAVHPQIDIAPAPVYITGDILLKRGFTNGSISSIDMANSNKTLFVGASSIVITRCKLHYFRFKNSPDETCAYLQNLIVSNSNIDGSILDDRGTFDSLYVNNTVFTNCIIANISLPASSTAESYMCTFNNCVINYSYGPSTYGCNYQNCIFTGTAISSTQSYLFAIDRANSVSYCLAYGVADNANYHIGSNNIFDQGIATAGYVFDNNSAYYELATGSPAIGTGLDGIDMGIYGGTNPFVPGGYPQQPTITKMVVPVVAGDSLNVSVEATIIN
ncbi:hypothetical protein [uncultured Draconibacterium sp.]|uniref:hypothetical protein n=1 Tax=uncultured Draconibacterium sp. TaxID=1573823 RepID=UPI003261C1AA